MPVEPVIGYPVVTSAAPPPTSSGLVDVEARARHLAGLGLPPGLAARYASSADDFDLRVWIVDNSGSMQTGDGNRIVRKADGTFANVRSSRWDELGESLLFHGNMAVGLGAATQFCVLNPPGGGIPQTIWCGTGAPTTEMDLIRRLRESSPTGRTPLCAAIRSATQTILDRAPQLRATGKRCVLVIASDGAATDGDVTAALRPLLDLPVSVVVRLCTDEEAVCEYWNRTDDDIELPLDVLDDVVGEAGEVKAHSPWLTYSEPLHRLREWGCAEKLLDLLDERSLSLAEMRRFVSFLFGDASADLPDPQLDWAAFESALATLLGKEPQTYDPLRGRMRPMIDVDKLRRAYRGGGGCTLQ